jgi:hypothetical protein
MFSAKLTAPGSRETTVWLIGNEGAGNERDAAYGLLTLSVWGDCPVTVAAFDASNNALTSIEIAPAQAVVPEFKPPRGTAKIAAVCPSSCTGTSTLEYDTPMVA